MVKWSTIFELFEIAFYLLEPNRKLSLANSLVYDSLLFTETTEDHIAWTETARRDYAKRALSYASDSTDDEWTVVGPLLQPLGKLGRLREHDPRKLWNAI